MALLTQKAILSTFEEMLQEMPFDKITVSVLVKRCGVSGNTFYYHYQDIYALLDAFLSKKLEEIRNSIDANSDWTVETKAVLLLCQKNPKVIEHILCSLSRDQLEQYIFTHTEDIFNKKIRSRTEDSNLTDEQIMRIASFCRYSFVGMFLKKNWDHFRGDINAEVDQMAVLFDTFVDSAAAALKANK